ncbi:MULTISPECIES: LacI family DNA-binding transcriptional regulator [Microbacterium]|uniref:LacI family transcriptional regulator n=1 Tax=Microbacterium wangchenii TaxID=2541726 RepID=A0ABX5SSS0_9MICO|nr:MULTISPECIES: LacI family DNA-binding transcriptional regulator [Microbacterium]MCK6067907.1 LacI family transcriptional regulator [Microbacterium sp. EYE_512]QBR89205.1 LacI family transcriptional regulator [Microbacterium wangchenii]TXK10875.1 LacI family transcriptional regulator [Microbacterium wangchenii]
MRGLRLQDVADKAGVSVSTVSNVVRDRPHVSAKMRHKVQTAIDELGYRPNRVARQLATGRTGFIALAFMQITNPYFAELGQMMSRVAERAGYRVLFEETGASLEAERELLTDLDSSLVDGILLQPSAISQRELARTRTDVPLVLLGEASAPLTLDHVMIDNVAAAREITADLIAAGCRRIAFVGHEETALSETSRQRLLGYQEALQAAGLGVDPARLVAFDAAPVGTVPSAHLPIGRALDRGLDADALVCRDDLVAFGAIRAAQERGLRIPADLAITGWDNTWASALAFPGLTTVSPNLATLASTAFGLLAERIDGYAGAGRHVVTSHSIVRRESSPPPAAGGE